MDIQKVTDAGFAKYGRVISGYSLEPLLEEMEKTPLPEGVDYVPSVPELEALPVFEELTESMYGGLPVQIGYCNGANTRLSCLEYHRTSELDIAVSDMVLLVARQPEIVGGVLDTGCVKAFFVPKGTAVELYATTLHYAPAAVGHGFRMGCVLPRGTNGDAPRITPVGKEDWLLWGANKWVITSVNTDEAQQGAYVGIQGPDVDLMKG